MAGFFSSLFGDPDRPSTGDASQESISSEGDAGQHTLQGESPAASEAPPPATGASEGEPAGSARPRPDARTSQRLPIFTDYHVPIFGQPDAEKSYFHGHIDGAFDGDADAFVDYIRAVREEQEAREVLEESEARRGRTQNLLDASIQAHASAAALDSSLALHREEESKALEAFDSLEEQQAAAEQEWKDTRNRGSRISAGLYLAAGLAFLAGDFVVSKAVVSQALKLHGGWDTILFAAGIAALAFLVKIAYERLVEKPYSEGKEGLFRKVIVVVAAITLVTLALLGVLRAREVTSQRMASERGATETFSLSEAAPSQTTESALPSTGIDPLDTAAFVFTAVLFALAGAICFGVALVTWHDYLTIRRPSGQKCDALKAAFGDARRTYEAAARTRADFERKKAHDESTLVTHEPVNVLRTRLADLDAHIPELRHRFYEAHREALEHAYRSGYTLARQNLAEVPLGMSMDDYYQNGKRPGNSTRPSGDGAPSATRAGGRRDTGARHGHRRPFLDLRDDILDAQF